MRAGRGDLCTVRAEIAAMIADDTRCFLCGDKFSGTVRRDKWHPDCCDLCVRDRARGFGNRR